MVIEIIVVPMFLKVLYSDLISKPYCSVYMYVQYSILYSTVLSILQANPSFGA